MISEKPDHVRVAILHIKADTNLMLSIVYKQPFPFNISDP